MIPVFSGPGADTHSILYQVAAIAMHHGATPTSGHYRCVFFPSECAVNAEPSCENPSLEGALSLMMGSWLLLLTKALLLVKFICVGLFACDKLLSDCNCPTIASL